MSRRRSPGTHDPEVVLVDFATGRMEGGHQEDYLAALEAALADRRLRVLAPFRAGSLKRSRVGTYWQELRALWRLLGSSSRAGRIIVYHSPEFRDFVLFWLAALLRRPADAVGLFVLRRDGAGMVGRDNLKARLLEILIPQLIRGGLIHAASDSRLALDHWLAKAGAARGSLLSVPCPAAATEIAARQDGGPVIGLFGRLRVEKGARHYDAVIRSALALSPEATVVAQVAAAPGSEEGEIAARLLHDWRAEPRVALLNGHLTRADYGARIASSDVVVLPYDSDSYGGGTSGVLHDALALGRTVLATPIPWAREAFSDHPDVVWLTGKDEPALAAGLKAAVTRALAARRAGATGGHADTFTDDWHTALAAATELVRAGRRV